MKKLIQLYAEYNALTNADVVKILEGLPPEKMTEKTGVYYDSILGVLNHLLITDVIWIRFFAEQFPEAESVKPLTPVFELKDWKEIIWKSFDELKKVRLAFDQVIIKAFELIPEDQYERELTRKNFKGGENKVIAWNSFLHLFNHETHHRGQIAMILDQMGIENDYSNLIFRLMK